MPLTSAESAKLVLFPCGAFLLGIFVCHIFPFFPISTRLRRFDGCDKGQTQAYHVCIGKGQLIAQLVVIWHASNKNPYLKSKSNNASPMPKCVASICFCFRVFHIFHLFCVCMRCRLYTGPYCQSDSLYLHIRNLYLNDSVLLCTHYASTGEMPSIDCHVTLDDAYISPKFDWINRKLLWKRK